MGEQSRPGPPRAQSVAGGNTAGPTEAVAEQLRLALDAGGFGTWRWDIDSGTTVWDERLEQLFGLPPGGFDGTFEAWVRGLHPEDRADAVAAVEEAVATRSPYVVQHRVVWPDGTVRWIEGRGAPLLDGHGEVTGTIGCCADVTERVRSTEELRSAVGALAAAAEQERIGGARLEFLGDVGDALSGAHDESALMTAVAASAVPRLGDWCAVLLLPDGSDGEPDQVVVHTDPDLVALVEEYQRRHPWDPDAPVGPAAVIRSGQPQFFPEIDEQLIEETPATDEQRELVRRLELRSAVVVPIRAGSDVLGAMQFVNSAQSRAYTPDDLALAQVVADRVGAAVENFRLRDRLARDRFRAALDELLDDVAIGRSVRDEDGRIVDFVIEFMNRTSRDGAGRTAGELVGGSVLEAYPGWHDAGLFEEFVRVVETGVPFVEDRREYRDVTAEGEEIRGWWTVRVVRFGDGYLASSRDDTEAVLAERELTAARAQQERSRLAVQLLQTAALPARIPRVAGWDLSVLYEPASADVPVGGDWYDAFEIPGDGRVGVVIGDVAGHGPEAARTMVQARNVLHAFALEGAAPHEVLQRADAVLQAGATEMQFVTCAYMVVDTDALAVQWSSAGHLPPVLFSGGSAEVVAHPPGSPLGVPGGARCTTARRQLVDGDSVVLFTDGLVERRGESITAGLDRLVRSLDAVSAGACEDLCNHLVAELLEGRDLSDDVAMVVFGPRG